MRKQLFTVFTVLLLILTGCGSGLKDGEEMSITIKHFRPTRHFEFDLR